MAMVSWPASNTFPRPRSTDADLDEFTDGGRLLECTEESGPSDQLRHRWINCRCGDGERDLPTLRRLSAIESAALDRPTALRDDKLLISDAEDPHTGTPRPDGGDRAEDDERSDVACREGWDESDRERWLLPVHEEGRLPKPTRGDTTGNFGPAGPAGAGLGGAEPTSEMAAEEHAMPQSGMTGLPEQAEHGVLAPDAGCSISSVPRIAGSSSVSAHTTAGTGNWRATGPPKAHPGARVPFTSGAQASSPPSAVAVVRGPTEPTSCAVPAAGPPVSSAAASSTASSAPPRHRGGPPLLPASLSSSARNFRNAASASLPQPQPGPLLAAAGAPVLAASRSTAAALGCSASLPLSSRNLCSSSSRLWQLPPRPLGAPSRLGRLAAGGSSMPACSFCTGFVVLCNAAVPSSHALVGSAAAMAAGICHRIAEAGGPRQERP
mmetsp:Transcript_114441/g.355383  ORF Transcript_114441/g.355383 Transcript_114441/m.355383 type:complete len:437 (+) Transcript_114441:2003-3313(+)